MPEKLDILLNSHQLECMGSDKERKRVFSEENSKTVIVMIYKDGTARPLCRYYAPSYSVPRCNPTLKGVFHEDDLGTCPYSLQL